MLSRQLVLPDPPTPLGDYVPAVQTGNLLFLSGMLPSAGGRAAVTGRLGGQLDLAAGRAAARLAALNALAVARAQLGSLERVRRVVRLSVSLVTTEGFLHHPEVADGASELLREVFGVEKMSTRLVYGVATLPLGVPVELEVILEVDA